MPDIYNMSDVFISYSRRDSDFVHRLFDDLKARDKEVWADFEDIPKAADWWAEIEAGIDAADAFLFIISPDSVQSDICRQEIDHALAMNKRFLPVLYREIVDDDDKAKVHPAVSSHNWIFFREGDDYDAAFDTLMQSIETDLDHNRTLTRLLVRAKEWRDNNKKASYLLHGEDLVHADQWLASSMNKKPAPTNAHAEYIRASRTATANRARRMLTFVSIGLVISIALALFAAYQTYQTDIARDAAVEAQLAAEASEQRARSLALAASASEALANNNPDLALVLAQQAIEVDASQQTVRTSVANAAYSPATRQRIQTGDVIASVVYMPSGEQFAAGFFGGRICLYRGFGEEVMGCLEYEDTGRAHEGDILWIHMSADGKRLLSSGSDDKLRLWDLDGSFNESPLIRELEVPGLVSSALASDGSYALFGTEDARFAYWDLTDSAPQYFDDYHDGEVTVIAINPDNTLALTGDTSGATHMWNPTELEWINIYLNPDNFAPITTVTFNPNSTIGVAGDYNSGISAWNLDTGTLIRTFQGHNETVKALTIADDGRSMFSASWDNSIIEWDLNTGRMVRRFYGHVGGINAMSLTSDNLQMVTGGYDNDLRIWHVRPPIQQAQYVTTSGSVETADWDDRHIVSGHRNGDLLIYNLQGELLRTIEHEDSSLTDLDISFDGQTIVSLDADCKVHYHNIAGEILWEFVPDEDQITDQCRQIRFRPEHNQVLLLSEAELLLIEISDQSTQQIPFTPGRRVDFRSAAFTSDGLRLAVGENRRDDNLHIFDVDTGDILVQYDAHVDGVLSIDFSADDTRMVTGSFDNDVHVWDVATGDLIWRLEGHSDRITSAQFSPDMDRIISSSNDQSVRLWDMGSGQELYTYDAHTDRVVDAVFSPDGRRIMSGGYDTTLVIWNRPQQLEQLLQWVEDNRYVRELTCTERNIYFFEEARCEGEGALAADS